MQSVFPTSQQECQLTPTTGFDEGRIVLEFMNSKVSICLTEPQRYNVKRLDNQSSIQLMLEQLRHYASIAPTDMALLIEDEVTSRLYEPTYQKAVKLINQAQCQIICLLAHRFRLDDFPKARVYEISLKQDGLVQMLSIQN